MSTILTFVPALRDPDIVIASGGKLSPILCGTSQTYKLQNRSLLYIHIHVDCLCIGMLIGSRKDL